MDFSKRAGLLAFSNGTEVNNSIISGNTVRIGRGSEFVRDCAGRVSAFRYSLITRNTCEFTSSTVSGSTGVEARLGPLEEHLGNTLVHSLLPNSPALDGGANRRPGSGNESCSQYDQRGVPRGQTLNSEQPGRCDMGAFEAGNLESKVYSFYLVDTDTGRFVKNIRSGDLILAGDLPENYSIRVRHRGVVRHVRFDLASPESNIRHDDGVIPFALTGANADGGLRPIELENGDHTLRATPYSIRGARGSAGVSKAVTFRVRM